MKNELLGILHSYGIYKVDDIDEKDFNSQHLLIEIVESLVKKQSGLYYYREVMPKSMRPNRVLCERMNVGVRYDSDKMPGELVDADDVVMELFGNYDDILTVVAGPESVDPATQAAIRKISIAE